MSVSNSTFLNYHVLSVFSVSICLYSFFKFQAENIYNDEEPDTPASELEQPAS